MVPFLFCKLQLHITLQKYTKTIQLVTNVTDYVCINKTESF
jgi:hypothetical protein